MFFQKFKAGVFLRVTREEEKTPNPQLRGYGGADPQPRTPNVSADSFIVRWTLGVERRTFSFCCEKGASTHSYVHLPVAIQSALHICGRARDRRISRPTGRERCVRVTLFSSQSRQPARIRHHQS